MPENMVHKRHRLEWLKLTVAMAAFFTVLGLSFTARADPLTIDDVLAFERIDQVALSPDDELAAVVIQRGALPGEVYGRTFLDLDPSRNDVWLVSRRTGERRRIADGRASAAGFWCVAWSPDGRRLAMLSTLPSGDEPRGGDNVRLHVWDRTSGAINRVSDAAVMTMTRSSLYRLDVRGGDASRSKMQRCHQYENAPFTWLDNHRLLAATLPSGQVSGLIDEAARPGRHAAEVQASLRDGRAPTATADSSGVSDRSREVSRQALLQEFDLRRGSHRAIATVPIHPFRGELTISVAPGGRQVAILATVRSLPWNETGQTPRHGDSWIVEKRLGLIALAPGAQIDWVPMPASGRLPLELLSWSPDGGTLAFRARSDPAATATPLFILSSSSGTIRQLGPDGLSVGGTAAGAEFSFDMPVAWVDSERLLARLVRRDPAQSAAPARSDWWLFSSGAAPINVTSAETRVPERLDRSSSGAIMGLFDTRMRQLDVDRRRFVDSPTAELPAGSSIVWPLDPSPSAEALIVATRAGNSRALRRVSLADGSVRPLGAVLERGDTIAAASATSGVVLASRGDRRSLRLDEVNLSADGRVGRLVLNDQLAAVDWGEIRFFDYAVEDGRTLRGAAILPPDYQAGRRNPVITWVYPGSSVRDENDYFLDPQMGGFYNLQLYAARGFVVLIPSMPLVRTGERPDIYRQIAPNVVRAVDRLIELGIADPERIGTYGQSFGGYGVFALVTQSERFKAAVAIAGISDFQTLRRQFDATARDYPGIEHEKSANWEIIDRNGLESPSADNGDAYRRNSPLSFVNNVSTPLLIIHGEQDIRGQLTQSEMIFHALHERGQTARLLRYWGENHSISLSPANVRSVFEETIGWFRTHLAETPPADR